MTEFSDELGDRFVIRAGRRGKLTLWVIVVAALLVGFGLALVSAVRVRTTGDAGGVGHVFIPVAAVAFLTLALGVVLARWWEDETAFRVVDGRLEVRHGFAGCHWPAVVFNVADPVAFTADASRSPVRVFVEQDGKRVMLGTAEEIFPEQYTRWATWMRHHGLVVDATAGRSA